MDARKWKITEMTRRKREEGERMKWRNEAHDDMKEGMMKQE